MYMGFFLCGHYCVKYLPKGRVNKWTGVLGFAVAYALNVWGLLAGFSTSLVHTLAVVSLFLLLQSCSVPRKAEGFVISSGLYTYTIYFVHVLAVAVLCSVNLWDWCPLWLRPIVIALLAFAISYLIAYVFDHIRFVSNAWVGI